MLAAKTKAKWEQDIVEKKRLQKMTETQAAFKSAVMLRRVDEISAWRRRPNERKLEEQKKQRKAEREIKRRKAYIRRLQEMELEVKDKAEALERKKAEAEREAEDARRPSVRGGGDSDRGGGFVFATSSRPR